MAWKSEGGGLMLIAACQALKDCLLMTETCNHNLVWLVSVDAIETIHQRTDQEKSRLDVDEQSCNKPAITHSTLVSRPA